MSTDTSTELATQDDAKPVQQRSMEWRQRRMGMVTASRFKDVMTQPRTKKEREAGMLSQTARRYMNQLLAERYTKQPCDMFRSRATDWGNDWEKHAFEAAVVAIRQHYDLPVEMAEGEYAFIQHPDYPDRIGCSPDGIVGDDGMLELKCPYNPENHIATFLDGEPPKEHGPQMQGSLWIANRSWYAFGSFDPRFKGTPIPSLILYEAYRDESDIDILSGEVVKFIEVMEKLHQRVLSLQAKRDDLPF